MVHRDTSCRDWRVTHHHQGRGKTDTIRNSASVKAMLPSIVPVHPLPFPISRHNDACNCFLFKLILVNPLLPFLAGDSQEYML